LDAVQLRDEVLRRLRPIVSIDAAFFATVDPATLLFTSALAEEPLTTATPMFLDNEFGQDDVNKFASLAEGSDQVGSLDHATIGERAMSQRYREVMSPMHLGDELRAALVIKGRCWGVLCLHREQSPHGFSEREIRLIRRISPHIAEGLRRAVVLESGQRTRSDRTGAGIVVLDEGLSLVSMNPAAELWLDEIADGTELQDDLPIALYAAAARLATTDQGAVDVSSEVRLRTGRGEWLTLRASHLYGQSGRQTAVVLEPATSDEMSSLVLDAHGLTPAQERVASLVLRGHSTKEIVGRLEISANTVQEHLGAVFEKFGVRSRRELVALLLGSRH
jgi:DNA-binding CsgD family transcriptional regulator/PAS domain-containing protein